MSWLIYALIGPASFAINNLIDKYVLQKRLPNVGSFTLAYCLVTFLIGVLIFIINGFSVLPLNSLLLILLAGCIQVVIFLSYFKALSLEEATRVSPLFQMIPVFSLVLGVIFLGESLKLTQFLGFILIFLGGFFLTAKKIDRKIFIPRPAFWLMMIASLGSASISILFKWVVGLNDFWQTIAWENFGTAAGGLLLFIFVSDYRQQFLSAIKKMPASIYGLILLDEAFYFIGRIGMRFALTLAPVALVSVLLGVQPIFLLIYTILLTLFAPQFLKEDISLKTISTKLLLMIVILIGVYFISI